MASCVSVPIRAARSHAARRLPCLELVHDAREDSSVDVAPTRASAASTIPGRCVPPWRPCSFKGVDAATLQSLSGRLPSAPASRASSAAKNLRHGRSRGGSVHLPPTPRPGRDASRRHRLHRDQRARGPVPRVEAVLVIAIDPACREKAETSAAEPIRRMSRTSQSKSATRPFLHGPALGRVPETRGHERHAKVRRGGTAQRLLPTGTIPHRGALPRRGVVRPPATSATPRDDVGRRPRRRCSPVAGMP